MAFVSQCSSCSTLTMMAKCPKCGGTTAPYQSTNLSSMLQQRTHQTAMKPQSDAPQRSRSPAAHRTAPSVITNRVDPHLQQSQGGALGYLRSNFEAGEPRSRTPTNAVSGGHGRRVRTFHNQPEDVDATALVDSSRVEVARLREALQRKEDELRSFRTAVAPSGSAAGGSGLPFYTAADSPDDTTFETVSAFSAQPSVVSRMPASPTPPMMLPSSASLVAGPTDSAIASNPNELMQAWQSNVRLEHLQHQLERLREAHNALLLEKDSWSLQMLKQQEQSHAAVQAAEEDRKKARDEVALIQRRAATLDADLVESQRRCFDAEQEAHRASETMFAVATEMTDLQRAVAAAKESDRLDLERHHQEMQTFQKRLLERDEEARQIKLKLADVHDELQTVSATRSSLQQQLSRLTQQREEVEVQKQNLERQLSLSVVEQRALQDEATDLRERLREATSQLKTSELSRAECEARLEEVNRKASHSNVTAQTSSSELNVLREQLERMTRDASTSRQERMLALEAAEALRTEVRRLSAANAALDEEVVMARHSNEALSSDLMKLRQEIQGLMVQFHGERDKDEARHKATVVELQGTIQSMKAEQQQSAELFDRRMREVDAERAAHHRTRLELKDGVRDLEEKLDAVTAGLRRAEAELERKQSVSPTKVAAEKLLRDGREDSLKSSLMTAETSIHEVRLQNDGLKSEMDHLARQLAQERGLSTNLNDLIEAVRRELGLLHEREELPMAVRTLLKERNVAIEEKEVIVAKLQQEQAALQAQVRESRHAAEQLQVSSDRIKQQAAETSRELTLRLQECERRLYSAQEEVTVQAKRLEASHQAALGASDLERRLTQQSLQGVQALHASSEEALRSKEAELRRLREKHDLLLDQLATAERTVLSFKQRETDLVAAVQEAHLQLESVREAERQQRQLADLAKEETSKIKRDADAAAQLLGQALDQERRLQEEERLSSMRDVAVLKEELAAERDRRLMETDVARVAERRCSELQTQLEHLKIERDQLTREAATMRRSQVAVSEAYEMRLTELEEELRRRVRDVNATTTSSVQLLAGLDSTAHQRNPPTVNSVSTFTPSVNPGRPYNEPSSPPAVSSSHMRGAASTYHAPPRPQEPLPVPQAGGGGGRLARERNDAMLAQLREQRSLSAGWSHAGGAPVSYDTPSTGPSLRQALSNN